MSTNINISLSHRSAIICLLAAASIWAQRPIDLIRWPSATPGVIAAIVAVFAAGITVLILINVRTVHKAKSDVREYSEKIFKRECARCRLNKGEIAALREITAYMADRTRPDQIFESIALFERCLDAYVEKRRGAYRTLEGMEDEDELLRFLRQKMDYNILTPEQVLFSTRNISTGQKVAIFTASHSGGQSQSGALLAQNTKVVHVGEFYFTVRVYDELKDRLGAFGHAELTIAFVRTGDAAYSVTARVMGVDAATGAIRLYHSLDLSRSQKRQYMRLEFNSPMRFRVLERGDVNDAPMGELYTARITDISGGGLSFFSDEPLKPGDIISVSVTLPGEAVSGVRAKVLGVAEVEGRTATRYRHHIQYIDIDTRQRERIVKFVFEKQRQLLQMR